MSEKINKRSLVETYIEAHPGYTLTEAARECGVSRAMVSIVRKELAIKNKVMAGARTPAPSLDEGDSPSTQTFAEIINAVLAGNGRKITPQEQAQIYSGLATHPKAQPGTVISALNGLRALEASAQQTNDLGPGIPLTREGKIHRLSLLLQAVGEPLAREAWEKAYPSTLPPETDNILGGNLEALDPIPHGSPDDPTRMAPGREEDPSSPSVGASPDPLEESNLPEAPSPDLPREDNL